MRDPGVQFEGPRRIYRHERQAGYRLFELCFGHTLDPDAKTEDDPPSQDSGWIVMVPISGPHKDEPVSQIGIDYHPLQFSGCRLRIGSIGGVSTHPDFRGLGLAGRILDNCAQELKAGGARLMLISGMRGLYTRTGNVPAMRFHSFQIQSGHSSNTALFPKVTLRPLTTSDRFACARIYQSEPVGYLRHLEAYPEFDASGHALLVELDASPAAYLLLHVPWEHREGPDQLVREVYEYAGSRLALAAGIHALLDDTQPLPGIPALRELRLFVPWQDADLIYLLHPLVNQQSLDTLPGHTLRILDFPGLQSDLEPYISARLPSHLRQSLRFEQSGPLLVDPDLGSRSPDICAITWESHRLQLSTAQMTRLVFGDWESGSNSALSSLPQDSPLHQIVTALFPLPSFIPGLNFR